MKKALIVIDVQNDFCHGGSLAVPDGDAVVHVCNRHMTGVDHVILTQDWHPRRHTSFASTHDKPVFSMHETPHGSQILWPDHCIGGTYGSEFHPKLETDSARLVIRKGLRQDLDSYSAFFENDKVTPTGLTGALRDLGVRSVICAGLATDFCVKFTAMDAIRVGLQVSVVKTGTRGVTPAGVEETWGMLESAGAKLI